VSEVTPCLAEDLTEEFWRALESDRRLDQLYWNEEFLPFLRATIEALQQQRTALVARVEESNATFRKHLEEDCIPNYVQQQRDSARARVKELEQQRDAVVGILRDAREHPDYVDGDMKLYMPDAFDDALKALGAEETK
jgi:hypothetical protein